MEHAAVTRDAAIARNASPRKRGMSVHASGSFLCSIFQRFPTSTNDSKPQSTNLQRLVDDSLRDHAMSSEQAPRIHAVCTDKRRRDERRAVIFMQTPVH